MTEKPDVQAIFDKIAPEYDKMNNIISLGTHKQWRQKVMAQLQLPTSARILDLATGTADWAIALAQSSDPSTQVIGLDFSSEMLAIGQKKVDASDVARRITLVQGDAMATPYEDNQFDVVTIGFGLRNLPDTQAGLAEMYRILKPGGQLVILETSQPDNALIRPVWRLYFAKIMPLFGKVFAKGKYDEYKYLDQTTENFVGYKQLAQMLTQTGFQKVRYDRFNFGAAAAHYASK